MANRTQPTHRRLCRIALLLCSFAVAAPTLAGKLTGTIRNAAGPLSNLRVDLVGPAKRVTVTNRDGKFVFQAPDGNYRLIVNYQGRQVTTDINLQGNINKTFTLRN